MNFSTWTIISTLAFVFLVTEVSGSPLVKSVVKNVLKKPVAKGWTKLKNAAKSKSLFKNKAKKLMPVPQKHQSFEPNPSFAEHKHRFLVPSFENNFNFGGDGDDDDKKPQHSLIRINTNWNLAKNYEKVEAITHCPTTPAKPALDNKNHAQKDENTTVRPSRPTEKPVSVKEAHKKPSHADNFEDDYEAYQNEVDQNLGKTRSHHEKVKPQAVSRKTTSSTSQRHSSLVFGGIFLIYLLIL